MRRRSNQNLELNPGSFLYYIPDYSGIKNGFPLDDHQFYSGSAFKYSKNRFFAISPQMIINFISDFFSEIK